MNDARIASLATAAMADLTAVPSASRLPVGVRGFREDAEPGEIVGEVLPANQ